MILRQQQVLLAQMQRRRHAVLLCMSIYPLYIRSMYNKPSPVLKVFLPEEDSANLKYRASPWHSTHVSVRHKAIQYYLFTLMMLECPPCFGLAQLWLWPCCGDFSQFILWQLVGTLGNWPMAESAMVSWLAQWWRCPVTAVSCLGLFRLPAVGPLASTSNYPKPNNLFQCR